MTYSTDNRPAADVWTIEVVPRDKTGKSKLASAGANAFNFLFAFIGMGGDSIGPAVADLVIRDRADNTQVFHSPQSTIGEAADMESRLREEMAQSSAAEFAESWGLERPST
ncbi:hypothetical protein [Microbacterium sp. NPDC087589]|uniref:hypothetical protein n=1 Tax=Microbacterium sp. NPDC087589 TaxID=3364191 RepID=UPI0037FAFAA6